jgi:hypothetical protein
MTKYDIVDRLNAASERVSDLHRNEVEALLIEAADTIEFLRSLLPAVEEVGLEDLPPKRSA